MSEPVLVIHGVGNRDQSTFEAVVRRLAQDLGPAWNLIPVYWGDLGAGTTGIFDTIPQLTRIVVRGSKAPAADLALAATLLGVRDGGARVREPSDKRWPIVADAAMEELDGSSGASVRSRDESDLREAIEEAWRSAQWLPVVEIEAVLEAVGRGVGRTLRSVQEDAGGTIVRDLPDLKNVARRIVSDMDTLVGVVVGNIAGQFSQYVRTQLTPGVTEFLGDVFVYQRHRSEIHRRVWHVVHERTPGYGTERHPLAILGHSLGGVIAFDLAVSGEPRLWAKTLVTFGSQSPFFHVLDPRGGDLHAYAMGRPVRLPATIQRWTNLWEPLDPLAFVAGKVFRLEKGEPPIDIPVRHLASSGLWTHSVYWRLAEVVTAVREALR